jgi:hypothetical protein
VSKELSRLRPQQQSGVIRSYANSQLPQRRAVHYQSTGSLHSDSPSSASGGSPAPSPTHTPQQRMSPAPPRVQPTPPSPVPRPALNNLSLAKRWSSTGDFNGGGPGSPLTSPHSPMAAASRCVLLLFVCLCAPRLRVHISV